MVLKTVEEFEKERKEVLVERMAERILYICMTENINPHQLLIALQNRMDLS